MALVGNIAGDVPVYINRHYLDADLKILTGFIEPHMWAGFSGGRKALCPGICGVETIRRFHGPRLLEPDAACAGVLQGNPVHEEALAVASLAGRPDFTVNVTLNESRELTDDDVIVRYRGGEVIGFTVLHASTRPTAQSVCMTKSA
jgi:nickel-dependent lactate racemase